eukprot:scaffold215170_cov25-Prasinocladus_malaysianus.AAC.1
MSVDERDMFVRLACVRPGVDMLRRAGVDTGLSHPLSLYSSDEDGHQPPQARPEVGFSDEISPAL